MTYEPGGRPVPGLLAVARAWAWSREGMALTGAEAALLAEIDDLPAEDDRWVTGLVVVRRRRDLLCARCGTLFHPMTKKGAYCSVACSAVAIAEKKRRARGKP